MTDQSIAGSTFGIGALSSILSGVGKYESGQQQKSADDYNADITLQNAANQDAAVQQRTSALVGRQAGAYAASGVDIASGSPLLIMAATQARGARTGEEIVQSGDEEAAMQRYYGKIAAFSGTMGGIGTFLNGISTDASVYSKTFPLPSPTVGSSTPFDFGL